MAIMARVRQPVAGRRWQFFQGRANQGGAYGDGTIFRMTPSGALTTLVSFSGPDGAAPSPVLVLGSDGNFYGTTEIGGVYGQGTVFE